MKYSWKLVNLKPLITSVLAQLNIPKNIQAMTQIQEKVITKADPQLIKRVLINLITNAVQAMPNGGELTVEAQSGNRQRSNHGKGHGYGYT